MATRQRGSSNPAAASKQQSGFIIMPTSAALPGSSSAAASTPSSGHAARTRERRIAISAYLRAAARGFVPGHELEDWLAAERELAASETDLPSQRQ